MRDSGNMCESSVYLSALVHSRYSLTDSFHKYSLSTYYGTLPRGGDIAGFKEFTIQKGEAR